MCAVYNIVVEPVINDTLKEDKPLNKGQYLCIYILYKITFKRGQPLFKGQNARSQVCSTVHLNVDAPKK